MSEIERAIVTLKQELAWLAKNTVGVPGERAAAVESWMNVELYLRALERAAEESERCAG